MITFYNFSRYYGGVIKQYRFLQVFIGNMMVLQSFCMKIKYDMLAHYKPLIFCVKSHLIKWDIDIINVK